MFGEGRGGGERGLESRGVTRGEGERVLPIKRVAHSGGPCSARAKIDAKTTRSHCTKHSNRRAQRHALKTADAVA